MVKVMPPGRPLERMVEQIGGLLPHHVMEEVVKVILEEIRDIPQGRKLWTETWWSKRPSLESWRKS